MIVLRRTPMRRPTPPPSMARVTQTDYQPRARATVVVPFLLRHVSPIEKETPIQHMGYMVIVRKLQCARCGTVAALRQFCHRDEGKGGMLKTDCREGWPGCAVCHYFVGSTGKMGKEGRRAFELKAGAETRAKVLAAGLWPARLPRWQE